MLALSVLAVTVVMGTGISGSEGAVSKMPGFASTR
jgi:hypothetical protein